MLQKETCHKDIMSFSGLLYPTLFMLYKTLQTILEAWNTLHHFLFLDKGWLLQDKQKNVLGYFFVEEGGRRATLIFCSLILFACAVASLVNFGGQVKLEKWGLDALLLPLSCVKINDSECTRIWREGPRSLYPIIITWFIRRSSHAWFSFAYLTHLISSHWQVMCTTIGPLSSYCTAASCDKHNAYLSHNVIKTVLILIVAFMPPWQ